jgi:hypothetical protein
MRVLGVCDQQTGSSLEGGGDRSGGVHEPGRAGFYEIGFYETGGAGARPQGGYPPDPDLAACAARSWDGHPPQGADRPFLIGNGPIGTSQSASDPNSVALCLTIRAKVRKRLRKGRPNCTIECCGGI